MTKKHKSIVLYDKNREVPITALITDMEVRSYSSSCHTHEERMFK